MAWYSYSWLILFAPLFSFAVIIFGTRVWDMLSRPRISVEEGAVVHEEAHAVQEHGSHGEDAGSHGLDDDEDPKVAHLTMGARLSAYVGIAMIGLACVYSWVLLFYSASVPSSLSASGITVFSYDWLVQPKASYVVAFHLDTLAIAMTVVVTTVSLLVNFYSQGYMENSA